MELTLEPARTALVVIDLQRGIAAAPTTPHSGSDVVAHAAALAVAHRAAGGTVALVHVTPSADGKDALRPQTDRPAWQPGPRPADWAEIVPALDPSRATSSSSSGSGARSMAPSSTSSSVAAASARSSSPASRRTSAWRARPATPSSAATSRFSWRTPWLRYTPMSTRTRSARSSRGSAGCVPRPRCWPRSRWRPGRPEGIARGQPRSTQREGHDAPAVGSGSRRSAPAPGVPWSGLGRAGLPPWGASDLGRLRRTVRAPWTAVRLPGPPRPGGR